MSTPIMSPEMSKKFSSNFIKAENFKAEGGVKLKCRGFEVIEASDPKYGAEEKSSLVNKGICTVGQTLRYRFEDLDPEFPTAKNFDSTSITFFIAFTAAAPNEGDVVLISREGEGKQTKYAISVVK